MADTKGAIEAQRTTARPHQPGQEVFTTILSEDVDWKPFPEFPSSVRLAVVVGQPSEPGPYTDCGNACHTAVKAKDYIFHPYEKR